MCSDCKLIAHRLRNDRAVTVYRFRINFASIPHQFWLIAQCLRGDSASIAHRFRIDSASIPYQFRIDFAIMIVQ
jgi:hypothetical protein